MGCLLLLLEYSVPVYAVLLAVALPGLLEQSEYLLLQPLLCHCWTLSGVCVGGASWPFAIQRIPEVEDLRERPLHFVLLAL